MIVDPVELDFSPSAWATWDPSTIAERLLGVAARWMVIGGWALDVYRERQTRPHEDLEIATPIWDFPQLRERLNDLEFFVAGQEGFWPVDGAGGAYFQYQQTFGRDRLTGQWRVDVIRLPDDGTHWICSADPTLRRPFDEAVAVSSKGIPYLRPQWVLFYKALLLRERDDVDFRSILPDLESHARTELSEAIRAARGNDHPWLAELETADH